MTTWASFPPDVPPPAVVTQILKSRANYIAVPLILMNALNGAISAVTIQTLPPVIGLGELSWHDAHAPPTRGMDEDGQIDCIALTFVDQMYFSSGIVLQC
jgi:hypothetical protein